MQFGSTRLDLNRTYTLAILLAVLFISALACNSQKAYADEFVTSPPPFQDSAQKGYPSLPSEPKKNDSTDTEAPEKWNIWLKYSTGIPSEKSFKSPSHIQVGFAKPKNSWFEYGLWGELSSAQVEDAVSFTNTSYTESRIYKFSAFEGGLHIQAQASKKISLFANIGYSLTTSELTGVTTTAPLNSSLNPSRQEGEILAPAYNVGLNYEHTGQHLVIGGSLGYSSTSSNPVAEIKDITIGIYLKYRRHGTDLPGSATLPSTNPFESPKTDP